MSSLTTSKPHTFLVYYQGFLAVAAVLIFFTRITVYLEQQMGIGIPLFWLIAFMSASIPLFFTIFERLHYIPAAVLIWCGAYLAMSLISLLISPPNFEQQFLEDQIRSIVFLLLMLVVFSQHYLISRWVKRTLLFVTIINVLMYVYEFFNPLAYYLEQHAPGRSSGFYNNANAAGVALIVGMIFTIDLFKPKYRLLYSLFIFLGIATTFSRGSILGWLIVIFLFVSTKVIPKYQLPLLFVSFFTLITILSTQINNLPNLKTSDGTALFQEDTTARVEFLLNPFEQKDNSSKSRISYVDESWHKFVRQPWIGNGLGSGKNQRHISARGTAQRSHNIYLDQMVEYGFLGFFVYPLLIFACSWKARGETKKLTLPFMIFSIIIGVFNHTALSEFSSLTSYAIIANFTQQSYLRNS